MEELGWARTPVGEITLRRRFDRVSGIEVYEVKLDDEFLMSSQFTVVEVALAQLGLAAVEAPQVSVGVAGLGLGYTAHAALADARVIDLTVVEIAGPLIEWHQQNLIPDTAGLAADPRLRLVHDDFFRLLRDDEHPHVDALLVDIDHSPRNVLHPDHQAFYTLAGLQKAAAVLPPEGVFALWSDDPPDPEFQQQLLLVFPDVTAHVVEFANPLIGGTSASTVYVARRQQPD